MGPRNNILEQAFAQDLAIALHELREGMSSLVSHLRGMAVNEVIFSGDITIPGAGVWAGDWSVPFASMAVFNSGATPVVVASGPPGVQAPSGPSAHIIGAGAGQVINLTGRELSIYGAAGIGLNLQLFMKPQPPSFSGGATVLAAASAQLVSRFAENNALLGGAATIHGATHDTGAIPYARFRALAASDVAGNLSIEQSNDGITWFQTLPAVGILADFTQATVLESIIDLRYIRATVVNGAAPQGSFAFNTALVSI